MVVALLMTAFLTWIVVDTRSVVVTLFAVFVLFALFVLFVQSVDRVVGVAVIVIIVNDTQATINVVRTIAMVVMPMVMVTGVMVVVPVPVVVVARPSVVVVMMAMVPPCLPSCPPLSLGSVTPTIWAELREKLCATEKHVQCELRCEPQSRATGYQDAYSVRKRCHISVYIHESRYTE